MKTVLYDTTLRDGMQGEGVQLSVRDKVRIAKMLDQLGLSYVEGGWPGSNPRDAEFFPSAARETFDNARLAAFGCTRRASSSCDQDPSIQALLQANVSVFTIVGKSSLFHAQNVLRISGEQNLELIYDTIQYLKARADEVIFDAEHFFDGLAVDPEYGLKALESAVSAGASYVVLCDTNGGSLPEQVANGFRAARDRLAVKLGIHAHNDGELAVANSLSAVRAGAIMVQGTINGYGERCGNANLVSIIPALVLKMGIECIPPAHLAQLTRLARTLDELSNRAPLDWQPYVGRSAFAHKSGLHVSAQQKNAHAYEHVSPALVGNQARVLVSELSGRSNIAAKLSSVAGELANDAQLTSRLLERVKKLENQGYQFEGAEASFRLMVEDVAGRRLSYFTVTAITVRTEVPPAVHDEDSSPGPLAIADIQLEVGGEARHARATGPGPVDAMDAALRELLYPYYPSLRLVKLVDYKVRVLSGHAAGAVVRVLAESSDGKDSWGTVGVSTNIIEASWRAVVEAFEYKLLKDNCEPARARSREVSSADATLG